MRNSFETRGKQALPDIHILEFEGIADNKIETAKMGIQKISQEDNWT